MLVLARKLNEVIYIGDEVKIKVLAIHEGQVKIGIEAPSSVRILREEVYDQIQPHLNPESEEALKMRSKQHRIK